MSQKSSEGYIYNSYGKEKYLGHVMASIATLRRYDVKRPVSIYCDEPTAGYIDDRGLRHAFDQVHIIGSEHCSIVGFKHHIEKFMPYDRNLYLDSDMVWCKDPDPLWRSLSAHSFTITGTLNADVFFGAPKDWKIAKVILLGERQKTLKKYNLTYLPRVQSGVIFTQDKGVTAEVCSQARTYLSEIDKMHFQSRLNEEGRGMESCEWSLAMAMATLDVPVYPWMIGHESAQMDFISSFTKYSYDFEQVQCLFYTTPSIQAYRGVKQDWLRNVLIRISARGRKGDHMWVTPYLLHFGWLHQKQPYLDFADRIYDELCRGKLTLDHIVAR